MAGGIKKWKAGRPDARAWDKISARTAQETSVNRDVFEDQQLDRGTPGRKKSTAPGKVAGVLAGIVVTVLVWVLFSLITVAMASFTSLDLGGGGTGQGAAYYQEETTSVDGAPASCYRPLNEDGTFDMGSTCYLSLDEVPVPDWYQGDRQEPAAPEDDASGQARTFGQEMGHVSFMKVFWSLGLGLAVGLIIVEWSTKQAKKANAFVDHSDVNDHRGDPHIAIPEEVQRHYDHFPDAGAHSSVRPNSILSHMMLETKGLSKVDLTRRAEADIIDEDGNTVYLEGEALEDPSTGEILSDSVPIVDEEYGDDLFSASLLPDDKSLRRRFDARKIPYNPGDENRDKLKGYDTLADLIKGDWEVPDYEFQRPAGTYVVDTAPVNTMVLAITRAGKGQTYIEPMIDMWSREKDPSNMVINDPKGELYVKNYVALVTRGYHPINFNLINTLNTDIYNPLMLAADAAREGDSTKCSLYIDNIGEVFFPLDGGEDPVWPNAANNAFKRAAFGLIDFYLEEERELRVYARDTGMDPATMNQRLDEMWGHVTLYNCYQMFVQFTSKKMKNPASEFDAKMKAGEFDEATDEEVDAERTIAKKKGELWNGQAEADLLTVYFNATQQLPRNSIRTLVGNAHNALVAMAGAEKMLASVYGIAITGMSFFALPTISALTSGRASQNVDLAGLSFPRRLGARFAPDYLKRNDFIGQMAKWHAFSDPMFTQDLGKDFEHEEIIGRTGWARYNFKGIFPQDTAYARLDVVNPQTGMLLRQFFFRFTKSYQLTLDGRRYVTESVTGEKVVRDGVFIEMLPVREGGTADGRILSFKDGDTMFDLPFIDFSGAGQAEKSVGPTRAIISTTANYSEKPKAVFLITPPHLMKYAKLVLILVKQLVDVSFDQSYMTKADQKPLYRTRYMLDELGNLQSDGNGIAGFETMLSIGLGQEQQFTLILQTLQQLRDVYGESVDKIVQGNVSNIIFLKSTDDSMIQTLSTMAGSTHRTHVSSKQLTQNLDKMVGGQAEGAVSFTYSTEEEPLIAYKDFAFIPPNNSIVLRAGDMPIWNRNETIMPMSWRLNKNSIKHPGHTYTLQTVPSLSSARHFDVRMNQPDFVKMLDKRLAQALQAEDAMEMYASIYGYKDIDIDRLDPDVWSDEIMDIIARRIASENGEDTDGERIMIDPEEYGLQTMSDEDVLVDANMAAELAKVEALQTDLTAMRYAEGRVCRGYLMNPDGTAKVKTLDKQIAEAYGRCLTEMQADAEHFSVGGEGDLRSADGRVTYIGAPRSQDYADARAVLDASRDAGSTVYGEDGLDPEDIVSVRVTSEFYAYLASLDSWKQLAGGEFDRAMAVAMDPDRD